MPAPHDAAVDDAAVPGTTAAGTPASRTPAAGSTAAERSAGGSTPAGSPSPGPASGETAADLAALRAACSRFLTWHGAGRAADLLATIPPDTQTDRYGEGGVVTELESEVMLVLGKPAAVFLPSGTMAQQAVLRVHADRRQRRVIVFHPACHIDTHEGRGYERLHQLIGRPAGERDRLLTVADLDQVAEPAGALVIELPQRDLGGQQPDWAGLEAQASWARERGAAVHLDGARLWESAAGYGKPPADVAALFDTVYVSFYKGLGALPGCCVAGPEDLIAEVREWRRRMGGTLFGLWPNAASALSCLSRRLPMMPRYLSHTRAIADALRNLPGVTIVPDPPQTPLLHLLLRTTAEDFTAAARRLATEQRVWTWPAAMSTPDPGTQRVELAVGDATLALRPGEVRDFIRALLPG
ncbi:MAG TPA: beta-eliminating lyase-related protein [Streptosporangiaceae bacterium]|nr:beta-eliminating lyase-related protein [Streptosporangiaceae bacterium]